MSFFISNTILKMQNTFIIKWSQAICRILNNFRNITWNCIQWKVWPFFSYFSYKVVVYLKPDKVLRLLYTLLLGTPSSPGCGYTSSSCALNSSSANKSGSSTQSHLSLSVSKNTWYWTLELFQSILHLLVLYLFSHLISSLLHLTIWAIFYCHGVII